MVLVGLSAAGITNTYIWKCTTNEQQIQTPFWRPLVLFLQNRATSHSACITSALISDLSMSCLACRQFFLCCRKHWKHLMDYEQKLQERKLEKLENIWVAVVPLISQSLPVWFQWDSFTNNHIVVKFTLHPLVQLGNTIVVMFKEIQSKYTRMRFPKYQSNRSKSKKWVSRFKI